ncbi:MAG TPA: undecaprenyl-diphosphate phosphatase [Bacteroidaceae bacterium]|nr:undecaprenyl-diphosphate phosphatase [Bacteroidaceae bacterium]
MDLLQTIIVSIVEGLTEYLPVSSTGHMIITQYLLGVDGSDEFIKAFDVIIQFGAILSVVFLYWKRFFRINHAVLEGEPSFLQKCLHRYDFYVKLLVAFLPAAVIGFLLSDIIDSLLENVYVVAIMLILGGVFMIFVDKLFAVSEEEAKPMTNRSALMIGFCQCIAMIPGVSRSMATIVGGMGQKLTRKDAAEFSFFLAVPTMAAASCYKLLKVFMSDTGADMLENHLITLLIGNVVAFFVALLAIKFFISFLNKHGFKAFGYYRIVAGIALLLMLCFGASLTL